jgi:hypothetical protein
MRAKAMCKKSDEGMLTGDYCGPRSSTQLAVLPPRSMLHVPTQRRALARALLVLYIFLPATSSNATHHTIDRTPASDLPVQVPAFVIGELLEELRAPLEDHQPSVVGTAVVEVYEAWADSQLRCFRFVARWAHLGKRGSHEVKVWNILLPAFCSLSRFVQNRSPLFPLPVGTG